MKCEKCGSEKLDQINGLTGNVERFCLACGAVQTSTNKQPETKLFRGFVTCPDCKWVLVDEGCNTERDSEICQKNCGLRVPESTNSLEAEDLYAIAKPTVSKYEKHRQITTQMSEIYKAKNQDYGNSFGKSVQAHGLIAAVVRLEDKMNRIASLVKSGNAEVKTESLQDTLIDMANYAIMTVIEMGNKK